MSMPERPVNLLDFLIASSLSRARKYGSAVPMDCAESIEIFDELDSLSVEEFSIAYAMYLIGSGEENDRDGALLRAKNVGFAPLETMAFDGELHLKISTGKREWRKNSGQSIYEARVGFGIGPFVLGRTRDEIRASAGDDTIEMMPELEGVEIWRYIDRRLSMTFSRDEQWRLASIDCEGAEYTLHGIAFVGKLETELLTLAPLVGIDDITCDGDYEENGKCFTSEKNSLMFWVAEGIVVNFSVMLLYDQTGDNPLWPS